MSEKAEYYKKTIERVIAANPKVEFRVLLADHTWHLIKNIEISTWGMRASKIDEIPETILLFSFEDIFGLKFLWEDK